MNEQLRKYRDHLVLAEKEAQQDFDKTVFALSGGAIGISFAFITDIVDPKLITSTNFLILAWIIWSLSLLCVLFSYYFSHLALRRTIMQLDRGTVYKEHPGGKFDVVISYLNPAGAILFVMGLGFMIAFVNSNLGV
jgi:hypothetical protein